MQSTEIAPAIKYLRNETKGDALKGDIRSHGETAGNKLRAIISWEQNYKYIRQWGIPVEVFVCKSVFISSRDDFRLIQRKRRFLFMRMRIIGELSWLKADFSYL